MVDHSFKVGDVVTWAKGKGAQDYKSPWKCPEVFIISGFFHGEGKTNDEPSDCVMWECDEYCPGASPTNLVLYTGPW